MNTYQKTKIAQEQPQQIALEGQYRSQSPEQPNIKNVVILILAIIMITLIILGWHHADPAQQKQSIPQTQKTKPNPTLDTSQNLQTPEPGSDITINFYNSIGTFTYFKPDNQSVYYDSIRNQVQIIEFTSKTLNSPNNILLLIDCITIETLILNPEDKQSFYKQMIEGLRYYRKIAFMFHPDTIADLALPQPSDSIDQVQCNRLIGKIDADYGFIRDRVQGYQWIELSQINFQLSNISHKFEVIREQPDHVMAIYSSINSSHPYSLQDNQDLYDIHSKRDSLCEQNLLILKTQLFNFISPLNFAYNNHFTICQLIAYPSISILQYPSINKPIIKLQHIYSTAERQYGTLSYKQFEFLKIKSQLDNYLCFVVCQSNLQSNQIGLNLQYLSAFDDVSSRNMRIVVTVVYPVESDDFGKLLDKIIRLSKHIRIIIRVRYQAIQTSLQIFEAAHQYCPLQSTIFSSRTNILLNVSQIIKTVVSTSTNQLPPIYQIIPNYHHQNGSFSDLSPVKDIQLHNRKQYDHYYDTHLKHAQIFKADLIRTLHLSDIKWQELEFYATEYSYAMMFLQSTQNTSMLINESLFRILQSNPESEKQLEQRKGLELRNFGGVINSSEPIYPIPFNALANKGLKRDAPEIIPRILHQIFLNDQPQPKLSPVRQLLTQTMLDTNPEFKYMQWRLQNITRQNFPIVYDALQYLLEGNKVSNTNYYAVIAGVMRIQILYHHGGIYCDMKTEGRKSLLPFLKYEQFFFHVGFGKKDGEGGLVNGLIGSIPRQKNFRKILTEFFQVGNITLPRNQKISSQAGSYRLIKAYKLKQLVVEITDFGPFLAGNTLRPCLNENYTLQFSEDQQVFEGKDAKNRDYKIGIPCKVNTQKYLQMYRSLGRTYFGPTKPFY